MKRSAINRCLDIAFKHNVPANHPQWGCYHHYSFILKQNKIIEWSTNYTGEPNIFLGYKSYQKIHSELMAFKRAKKLLGRDLGMFEILNIRLNKNNELKNSFPCNCCLGWLKENNCSRICYSHEAGFSQIIC